MNAIGHAIVSRVIGSRWAKCPACGPGVGCIGMCNPPKQPGCHARCARDPDPAALEAHPECREYVAALARWEVAHHLEFDTSGRRVGPLHYFQDCKLLSRKSSRRGDAKVISFDADTASCLGLAVCKECVARMAPFEKQIESEVLV
jgi:hypothetical protein